MQLYETIVHEWGQEVGIPIQIGNRQFCRVEFPDDGVTMQIDLDPSGERIVLGCNLGIVNPGPYQNLLFKAALRANGLSTSPRGVLSYSDKLGAMILHEFLPIATASAEKLGLMVILFRVHAKVWIQAIKDEQVPLIEEEGKQAKGSGMFGLS